MLDFYAETAVLHMETDATSPHRSFQLFGKREIGKHLRAVFNDHGSHRIEHPSFDEEFLTYREICEYPDGARLAVDTTLTVRGGTITHQTDRVGELCRPAACLIPAADHGKSRIVPASDVAVPTRPSSPSSHPTH
jgi:hypothetical protein